jgi:hypothetical protein
MIVAGAAALLIFVVAAIGALLALDLSRTEHRHWLDALKSWQQLIGAVLGFLGAAGVLVLSTAISQNNELIRSAQAAHAIGLGLAYEAQAMGVGLKAAQQIGHKDLENADPGSKCLGYASTLQQTLVPTTPVYDAVLPRMVDFGDENLHAFVTFHALYANLLRSVPDIIANDCRDAATSPVFLTYMVGQVDEVMLYYAEIADTYGIAPPDAGNPSSAAPSSAPSN